MRRGARNDAASRRKRDAIANHTSAPSAGSHNRGGKRGGEHDVSAGHAHQKSARYEGTGAQEMDVNASELMKPTNDVKGDNNANVQNSTHVFYDSPNAGVTLPLLRGSKEALAMWRSMGSLSCLNVALSNIGCAIDGDILSSTSSDSAHETPFPFTALSLTRIVHALAALNDAASLLASRATDPKSDASSSQRAQQQEELIAALLALCDSAIPMRLPPLKPSLGDISRRQEHLLRLWSIARAHTNLFPLLRQCASNEDIATVLFRAPLSALHMPTGMLAMSVEDSRGVLSSLRESTDYVNAIELIPQSMLSCGLAKDGPSQPGARGAKSDLPHAGHPSSTVAQAWQREEQNLLSALLEGVNGGASVDSELWGAASFRALSYTRGSFVLCRRARCAALAKILEETELFGLPPFLRSIRCRGDADPNMFGRSFGLAGAPSSAPTAEQNLVGGPAASATPLTPQRSSLFVTVADLDPKSYLPTADKEDIVQSEINELIESHCRFGMLIGEADQIALLLKYSLSRQRVKCEAAEKELSPEGRRPPRSAAFTLFPHDLAGCDHLKRFGGHAEEVVNAADSVEGADPLLPYAIDMVQQYRRWERESRHGGDGASNSGPRRYVHWLCENRWHPSMKYYAVVFATVASESDSALDATDSDTQSVSSFSEGHKTAEQDLNSTSQSQNNNNGNSSLAPKYYPTCYIAAVMELSRS